MTDKDPCSSKKTCADEKNLMALASHQGVSTEVLKKLAQHEDEAVRIAVATNESTPESILELLLHDESPRVRECVEGRNARSSARLSIHPTAIVHEKAVIGENVIVGPFSIIHENVEIGANTFVGAYCEIGHPTHNPADGGRLIVGKNSCIRSHSIFYEGSTFGENLLTGHRVTVREKTRAGKNFQIGTLGDIQGHCEIGDFVRLHSNVHIGQKSKINDYVWIFPYVVLTNDPHPPSNILKGVTIESYVAIATMSIVLPGVTIREGALIGAHSSVSRDVEPDTVVAGSPAKYICKTDAIKLKDGSKSSAYPWRRHFHRGYPPEVVEKWVEEFRG